MLHVMVVVPIGKVEPETRPPGPEQVTVSLLFPSVGSDTVAFEKVPSNMDVHVHLLVEKGIHIIECLNLEELARARISDFVFIAAPLKIRGATGAPMRPIALV